MAFLTTSLFPNGCPTYTASRPSIYNYPIGFSLKAAMAIAWKAYIYRMVGEVFDPPFVADSVNSNQLRRFGSPLIYTNKMSELLCFGGENNVYDFSEETFGFLFGAITDKTPSGRIYYYNDLYYINLFAAYGSIANTLFVPSDEIAPVGILTIQIGDESFSCNIQGYIGTSCNLTVTISSEREPN